MKMWAVLGVLLLTACDQAPSADKYKGWSVKEVDPAAEQSALNHYSITAAGAPVEIKNGGIQAYVWKLDNRTGAITLCNYLYTPAFDNKGHRVSCDE